jgi:hypothetical protein
VKYPEIKAKSFLAFYWGGAMIGRFLGAISLGDNKSQASMYIKMLITAIAAYLLIYGIVYFESVKSGNAFAFSNITPFIIFLVIQYIGFIIGKSHAGKTLLTFSMIVVTLLVITMVTTGHVALWTIIGIGLFNSIMWSNIFTLAIKDLGQHTSQGSSLLVMMILGGYANNRGVLVGAGVMTILTRGSVLASLLLQPIIPNFNTAILIYLTYSVEAVILIFLLIYRPKGLIAETRIQTKAYELFDFIKKESSKPTTTPEAVTTSTPSDSSESEKQRDSSTADENGSR